MLKTVKQIADLCGIEPKNVHTYKLRAKVVIDKDGFIDDEHPINKEFIVKMTSKKTKEQPKKENKNDKPVKKPGKKGEKRAGKQVHNIGNGSKNAGNIRGNRTLRGNDAGGVPGSDGNKANTGGVDSNLRTPDIEFYQRHKYATDLKNKKVIEEIKALELQNKIKSGEMIPTQFVAGVFARYVRTLATSFFTMAENLTTEMCIKLQADREITAKFKGEVKESINKAIEKAQDEAKKDMEILVKQIELDEK